MSATMCQWDENAPEAHVVELGEEAGKEEVTFSSLKRSKQIPCGVSDSYLVLDLYLCLSILSFPRI